MIVKVFEKNKNGKIQFSVEELEKVLNEVYWEGYYQKNNSWVYQTPPKWDYVTTTISNDNGISINGNINDKK